MPGDSVYERKTDKEPYSAILKDLIHEEQSKQQENTIVNLQTSDELNIAPVRSKL